MTGNSKLILYHTGFYEIKKPQLIMGEKPLISVRDFIFPPTESLLRNGRENEKTERLI